MSTYGSLLTTAGATALAYAASHSSSVDLTTIALGDGGGTFVSPSVNDTDCVNEVYRASINSITVSATNPSWIIVELILPPNVGGFTIREFRIYDANGVVIYTGNWAAEYKPLLSEGMSRDQVLQFIIEYSNVSVITLMIDPSAIMATHTYVISAIDAHNTDIAAHSAHNTDPNAHTAAIALHNASTSAHLAANFATKVGVQNRLYNFANSTSSVSTTSYTASYAPAVTAFVDGMELCVDIGIYTNTSTAPTFSPNGLTAHTIVKEGGALLAGDMPKFTHIQYDSTANHWVLLNPVTSIPSNLPDVLSLLSSLSFPTVDTATNKITVTSSTNSVGGTVSIPANIIIELGKKVGNYGTMVLQETSAFTSVSLGVSSTYYLRAKFIGDVFTVYTTKGTDSDAIPSGLVGTVNAASGGGFDSTVLDILLAKIVTGTTGTAPVITTLKNSKELIETVSLPYLYEYTTPRDINISWARVPKIVSAELMGSGSNSAYIDADFKYELVSYSRSLLTVESSYFVWNTSGGATGASAAVKLKLLG